MMPSRMQDPRNAHVGQLYHGCGQDGSVTDDATHVMAWHREKARIVLLGGAREGPCYLLKSRGQGGGVVCCLWVIYTDK